MPSESSKSFSKELKEILRSEISARKTQDITTASTHRKTNPPGSKVTPAKAREGPVAVGHDQPQHPVVHKAAPWHSSCHLPAPHIHTTRRLERCSAPYLSDLARDLAQFLPVAAAVADRSQRRHRAWAAGSGRMEPPPDFLGAPAAFRVGRESGLATAPGPCAQSWVRAHWAPARLLPRRSRRWGRGAARGARTSACAQPQPPGRFAGWGLALAPPR